jgi:S-adenosylmethionine uptake transporter
LFFHVLIGIAHCRDRQPLLFHPYFYYDFIGFFSTIIAVVLTRQEISNHSHPSLAFLFREWRMPANSDWLTFLGIGCLAAAGFYFQSQAYRLAQPSKITAFEYIAVPLSVFWGYLIWEDILEIQSFVGMILIVGGGLYIFSRKRGLTKNERGQ